MQQDRWIKKGKTSWGTLGKLICCCFYSTSFKMGIPLQIWWFSKFYSFVILPNNKRRRRKKQIKCIPLKETRFFCAWHNFCVFSHAGWRHAPSSVRPLLDKNRITFVLLVFLYQLYSSAFHYMLVFIRFSCSKSLLLLCTVINYREIFSDDDDVISSECFDKKERKVKERSSLNGLTTTMRLVDENMSE